MIYAMKDRNMLNIENIRKYFQIPEKNEPILYYTIHLTPNRKLKGLKTSVSELDIQSSYVIIIKYSTIF